MENTFEMVAKTFKGLEDVLRDELISLGAENVELGVRMVTFHGDKEMMYKANLCCRTALRILKPIVKFHASDTDELYDHVRELDWEQFMTPDTTFSIDTTVNSADFTHSKYVAYRVKDAIADHFNDSVGRRPSIRLSGADIRLNVHIDGQRVTISLDSSGAPLNQRGYRVEQTEAPLNEVLAAGIIMKTGWRGDCDFVDPMCGSGTFLIEAALIAANINPGIYRSEFAFEKWPDFDADLFEQLYNDDSQERDFNYKIKGGDISADAIAIARKNVKNARLENMIELSWKPFAEWTDNPEPGILVTNPPYGERLKPDDLEALYKGIGSTLKKYFPGWHAWILGYKDEQFMQIGLKPSVKFPLLNGSLECSLHEYVLFDGSYSDFKTEGGTVHNSEFKREGHPHFKRMSEEEWGNEARKFNKKGDFKKERDRDRDFHGKKEFKRDRDRDRDRDFRDKKDFRDKRDFKGDKRDFRDKKDFRDKRDFKGDKRSERRPEGPKPMKEPKAPSGPKISADKAVVFNERAMRSRRKKEDPDTQND